MAESYFDYNATTPLEPRVLEAMLPWFATTGNAASVHGFGRRAREATEGARAAVARLLGGSAPEQVVFTASGTEANNAVLEAVGSEFDGGHVVVSAFEHPSVLRAASRLERHGFEVSRVRPREDGRVAVEDVAAALRPDTRLVALMLANNEIGTLQPVAEVARLARQTGTLFLCDAVQAVGKVPVSVDELDVDYLVLGAHKFYGPLGAAALWVRTGAPFEAFLVGGSQERRRRAGTLNVPAIVGLGKAAELAEDELTDWSARMLAARDAFESGLARIPGAFVHAAASPRLPNTTNVATEGAEAEALMVRLDLRGFAVSAGSACSSGRVEVSTTMAALGVEQEIALSSLRVSFGKDTRSEEVEGLLAALSAEVAELRGLRAASRE